MTFLEMLVSNAVTAAALAAVVFLVTRVVHRPPVVYGLWLLVMLKLVTPPLFEIPLLAGLSSEPEIARVTTITLEPASQAATVMPALAPDTPAAFVPHSAVPTRVDFMESGSSSEAPFTVPWGALLLGLWGLGSLGWIGLATSRVWAFHRSLQRAPRAPQPLQDLARRLADEFGLRTAPLVRVTSSTLPPVLWAVGRPRTVLVPDPLLRRLSSEQVETLIAHEIAHLKRRDHWVRGLEALVVALYWWHPVVWWARRELQQAEEQCCDAWVLWKFPKKARAYAQTLLETVEFLSEARSPIPPGASGFGTVKILKRRFQMILSERFNRSLTPGARAGLLMVALCILPLTPLASAVTDGPSDRIVIVKGDGETQEFVVDKAMAEKIRRMVEKTLAEREAKKSAKSGSDPQRKTVWVYEGGKLEKKIDGSAGRWLEIEGDDPHVIIHESHGDDAKKHEHRKAHEGARHQDLGKLIHEHVQKALEAHGIDIRGLHGKLHGSKDSVIQKLHGLHLRHGQHGVLEVHPRMTIRSGDAVLDLNISAEIQKALKGLHGAKSIRVETLEGDGKNRHIIVTPDGKNIRIEGEGHGVIDLDLGDEIGKALHGVLRVVPEMSFGHGDGRIVIRTEISGPDGKSKSSVRSHGLKLDLDHIGEALGKAFEGESFKFDIKDLHLGGEGEKGGIDEDFDFDFDFDFDLPDDLDAQIEKAIREAIEGIKKAKQPRRKKTKTTEDPVIL